VLDIIYTHQTNGSNILGPRRAKKGLKIATKIRNIILDNNYDKYYLKDALSIFLFISSYIILSNNMDFINYLHQTCQNQPLGR